MDLICFLKRFLYTTSACRITLQLIIKTLIFFYCIKTGFNNPVYPLQLYKIHLCVHYIALMICAFINTFCFSLADVFVMMDACRLMSRSEYRSSFLFPFLYVIVPTKNLLYSCQLDLKHAIPLLRN